jgi:hypothetical protein
MRTFSTPALILKRLITPLLILLLFLYGTDAVSAATPPPTSPATPPASCSPDLKTDEVYKSIAGTCWACPLYEAIMTVSTHLGPKMSTDASGNATPFVQGTSKLLGVMLALYILVAAGKLVLPFGPVEKAQKVGNQIWSKIIIGIICLLMVRNYDVYWDYIYQPITMTGMRVSTLMLQAGTNAANMAANSGDYTGDLKNITFDETAPEKSMSQQMGALQQNMGIGVVVGWASLNAIFSNGNPAAQFGNILPAFGGIIIALLFGIVILIFPLYMIDAVLRWSVANILAPFFIACYVFDISRPTAMRALRSIIQSSVTLVMLSAIVAFSGVMMSTIVTSAVGFSGTGSLCGLVQGASKAAGMGALTSPITPSFWMFLALGLLIIKLMGMTASLAASLVGAVGQEADSFNRANQLANTLKGVAVATVGLAVTALTAGAAGIAGGVAQGMASAGGGAAKVASGISNVAQFTNKAAKVATKTASEVSKQTDA